MQFVVALLLVVVCSARCHQGANAPSDPNSDSCALVRCGFGTICELADGRARCIRPRDESSKLGSPSPEAPPIPTANYHSLPASINARQRVRANSQINSKYLTCVSSLSSAATRQERADPSGQVCGQVGHDTPAPSRILFKSRRNLLMQSHNGTRPPV